MEFPNIILVSIDCLRADRVSCYGHDRETTPEIDALASEGYRWEQCYSTGPRTNESFPGIIASALSTDSGYISRRWHRTPPSPTIASWLSSKGYETVARLANPQLAEMKGYAYGFDSFKNLAVGNVGWGVESKDTTTNDTGDNRNSRLASLGSHIHNLRSNVRNANNITRWALYAPIFYTYREYQQRSRWPTVDGEEVTREIIKTLPQPNRTPDQPIFGWAHFNDIHAPINHDRTERSELESVSTISHYNADIRRISQQRTATYNTMYDSMIRYVDRQVGKIIKYLKKSNMWEESVLIITADHGEALFDRGIYGHASGQDRHLYDTTRDYMYNELLRVPLIIGGGAIDGTQTIVEPTSTGWLYEIIAEITDLNPVDFVRKSGRDSHFNPDPGAVVLADALTEQGHTFAAISGKHKLITKSLHPDDSILDDAYYFNLKADPEEIEKRDSLDTPDRLVKAIRDNIITLDDLKNSAPSAQIQKETQNLLSQLGYMK
ncbi:sulfatase [Haladaptatus sp. CMAA 1911]|uniref:sulfatase n=1 Tax=unclassified Haladaptatus TaxID=2622732 RepID=UPI00375441A1